MGTAELGDIWGASEDDIWGASEDDIWAVGVDRGPNAAAGSALIYHYDGQSWTRAAAPGVITPSTPPLSAIWGTAHNNVWAVGAKGTILRLQ